MARKMEDKETEERRLLWFKQPNQDVGSSTNCPASSIDDEHERNGVEGKLIEMKFLKTFQRNAVLDLVLRALEKDIRKEIGRNLNIDSLLGSSYHLSSKQSMLKVKGYKDVNGVCPGQPDYLVLHNYMESLLMFGLTTSLCL